MGAMSPPRRQEEHQVSRCSFRGCQKMKFGTLDFFLRCLTTTLVRELRFSGQRTPPLCWRSAAWLSVQSARTKHLVACVCFVFPLCLLYYLSILMCTPRNTSGCRDEGGTKTVAATMPSPAPLSPDVCMFPHNFLTNIQRHGGDVPAQTARRTPGVKMLFRGFKKNKFGTLDFSYDF